MDLASFRELEAFAQLGTDVDADTQARLDRGYAMTELLKQGQYKPMNVTDQVLSIYAGTRGHLDKIPRKQISLWETEFLSFMREQKSELRNRLTETKKLSDADDKLLAEAIKEFQTQYSVARAKEAEAAQKAAAAAPKETVKV